MNCISTKAFIALLTFCLLASFTYSIPVNNGEPGCQTEEEIAVKNYRHFKIKTIYWECVALGQPAVLQHCPIAHGFLDAEKQCVHLSLWYWTPTVAPPSAPATVAAAEA